MQAYLGTIACKFGGDPVIACELVRIIAMTDRHDSPASQPFFHYPAKSWEKAFLQM